MRCRCPTLLAAGSTLVLAACGTLPGSLPTGTGGRPATAETAARPASALGLEVVLYALSLMDTGYRFGGRNPGAGLDCSGMVSYVYERAVGLRLGGSAADMARHGRPVAMERLRPGDLVFFNTLNRSYSHVGIYIGDGRFIHAPGDQGRVRTDSLAAGWFASRFEAARTYLD
jgi:cell wall-associated NlpC family hydrolase